MTLPSTPRWTPLVTALLAVWLIWGSTYLAMAYVVDGLPPFLAASLRHASAGLLVLAALRLMGRSLPTLRQWGGAVLIGTLMLVLGNGVVFFALKAMPSGLATLLLAVTPAWVVLGTWCTGGKRPGALAVLGIIAGITGVALLCQPGSTSAPWWSYALVIFASWSWAAGVVLAPKVPQVPDLMTRVGAQMIAGGVVLLPIGVIAGERMHAAPLTSWLAMGYLVLFGSIIAFTAYSWLQRHTSPALATSNNYVNPLVAVTLGTWLRDEPLTGHLIAAAVVILLAIALVVLDQRRGISGTGTG